MKEKIKKFLIRYNLFSDDKTLIIGFSGGFDSMCLLNCLKDLKKEGHFNLLAMHLNHNWRKEKALIEQKNCEDYCDQNKIRLFIETLPSEIPQTETVARQKRYEFFLNTAFKNKADAILLAHNQNDVVETVLYRIFKGTGIEGLNPIEEKRFLGTIPIYRPMLEIKRNEIEAYCQKNNLKANEDDSNYDTKYSRNKIRHEILPLIEQINKNYKNAILNLSKIAKDESSIVEKFINNGDFFISNKKIALQSFLNQKLAIQRKLIYILLEKSSIEPSFEKINDIIEFIFKNQKSKSGKTYSIFQNQFIFVNNLEISITEKNISEKKIIKIEKENSFKFDENTQFIIKKEIKKMCDFPNETDFRAFINLKDIQFPLILRNRQEGDIIQPFGMQGKMKFKKYLINKNIPKHKRDDIIVLAKKNEILWAVGLGISEKLRIKDMSSHYLEIRR